MALYKPQTRVVTTQMPYLALVTSADPQFERRKHWDVEYEMSNKPFFANPYTRGSFNSFSNTYPVGAQQGGLDPLVEAARPMFSGTPDGKGWA